MGQCQAGWVTLSIALGCARPRGCQAQLAPHAQLAHLACLVLGTEQRQLCEASYVVPQQEAGFGSRPN